MQKITIKINATIDLPDDMSMDELMDKVQNEECKLVIEGSNGLETEIELQYPEIEETNE